MHIHVSARTAKSAGLLPSAHQAVTEFCFCDIFWRLFQKVLKIFSIGPKLTYFKWIRRADGKAFLKKRSNSGLCLRPPQAFHDTQETLAFEDTLEGISSVSVGFQTTSCKQLTDMARSHKTSPFCTNSLVLTLKVTVPSRPAKKNKELQKPKTLL